MLREGPISAAVSVALSTTTEMLLSQKGADPGILLMKAASGVEFAETGSVAERTGFEPSVPLFDTGRVHHSPSMLSTKRQRSILMFANQVIWGTSANIGL
jgi:hypothetical protein